MNFWRKFGTLDTLQAPDVGGSGPLTLSQPILLWLTDRSRYETGNKCPRERLLEYHWGPHGYGIQKAAVKIPLATGDVIHTGLALVMLYCELNDALPPAVQVDLAVQASLDKYAALIESRGLQHWEEEAAQQQRLIAEQRLLIEGLIRAWTLWHLPEILRDYKIVYVERESVSVFDCTCGIGDRFGTLADHVAGGCEGIGVQTRADFVAQHRTSGNYAYNEIKTIAENNIRFRETYETTMQPYLGTLGIEDELGIDVTEIYIHGLIKGKYSSEYNPDTKDYDGPEYQNSRLCYGYKDESNPAGDAWAVKYQWKDDAGMTRRLPKSWKRTSVAQFGNIQEYLEAFAEDLKPQVLVTLGPLPKKEHVREAALDGWLHEERHIRWALHQFSDLMDANNYDWAARPVQEFLNQHFRPTFDCQRYGGRYKCTKIPICHKHPGWEDPIGLLGYVPRRPHHLPEEQQAIERGCLAPAVAVETAEE